MSQQNHLHQRQAVTPPRACIKGWRVWGLQVVTQAVGADILTQISPIHLNLLAPELIHTGKDSGILLLELMPQ